MTAFDEALDRFISQIHLEVPQGVLLEVDHFLPHGWTAAVRDGVHIVEGPGGVGWPVTVRKLIGILAYSEGSLVNRASPDRWEFYTWRNREGQGFKVVFLALAEPPA